MLEEEQVGVVQMQSGGSDVKESDPKAKFLKTKLFGVVTKAKILDVAAGSANMCDLTANMGYSKKGKPSGELCSAIINVAPEVVQILLDNKAKVKAGGTLPKVDPLVRVMRKKPKVVAKTEDLPKEKPKKTRVKSVFYKLDLADRYWLDSKGGYAMKWSDTEAWIPGTQGTFKVDPNLPVWKMVGTLIDALGRKPEELLDASVEAGEPQHPADNA